MNITFRQLLISCALSLAGYLLSGFISGYFQAYAELLKQYGFGHYIYFCTLVPLFLGLVYAENKVIWSKIFYIPTNTEVWGVSFGLGIGCLLVYVT